MKTVNTLLGTATALCFAIALNSPAQAQSSSSAALPLSGAAAAALTVTSSRPMLQTWPTRFEAGGLFQAWQEVVVSAEIGGQQLVGVNADVGQDVHKGDVLAELSSDAIRLEIKQREAAVLTAQADLEQASAAAGRSSKLRSSGAVSEQSQMEAQVAEKKAQAQLASAEAALSLAQLNLRQTTITALDDGVISSRTAALGSVVAAGAELFRMIRQGRIEWHAEVPLKDVLNIHVGTKAILPTPIGDVAGSVRLIEPTTSAKNGRITVVVAVDKPDNAPPPTTGVFATGYFVTGESSALTVPASAITLRDGFSYVYTVNSGEPTTVSRKGVSTGRRSNGDVEIVEGLSASDTIVTTGGAFLNDGDTVRVTESSSEPGTSE